MLFHSPEFLFAFLPIVLLVFHLLSRFGAASQHLWLIASSFFFYGTWRLDDLAILLVLMSVTYVIATKLRETKSRLLLTVGIGVNLGALAYFKYVFFFLGVLNDLFGSAYSIGAIALPLGISFFVFQKIAYLVDSYQDKTIKHGVLDYALFVSFFPQLIAGPIVHQKEMLRQFRNRPASGLRSHDLAVGLTVFAFGLFKKIVLADAFASMATSMFSAAAARPVDFTDAWVGVLSYTFQIYFDFSGYTDMAIGLGRMFGIRLPLNFNSPYKSLSIVDFWRRWHMTLSRFLRDYLYIPLGGGRLGRRRQLVNVMIVMLLGGLWHGAAWTFVIWGALHGMYLAVNHLWRRVGPAMGNSLPAKSLAWLLTFLAVIVAWVFFRAPDVAVAGRILMTMVTVPKTVNIPGIDVIGWLAAGFIIATQLPNTQQIMARARPGLGAVVLEKNRLIRRFSWQETPAWAVFGGVMFLFGVVRYWSLDTPPEFIYFNF